MKFLNILGSTGSIGTQTIEIIIKFPELFSVNILCGFSNYQLIAQQVLALQPKFILINHQFLGNLKKILPNHSNIYDIDEFETINKINKVEISVIAIAGFAGLKFCWQAIEFSDMIVLGNKESIICGGKLLLNHAHKFQTKIIPIDSEHNSLFQLLENKKIQDIEKMIITASGGPFYSKTKSELENITAMQAANHPKWKMGMEISINSATLMNKALELIEAFYLFGTAKLEAIIHPQSIIHAMIELQDGMMMAVMANPDMKLHIAHALFYPNYAPPLITKLNLIEIGKLEFFSTDIIPFPFIALAQQIINNNPQMAIVFNAANEVALRLFIAGKIKFLDIAWIVEETLTALPISYPQNLEEIMDYDLQTREIAMKIK